MQGATRSKPAGWGCSPGNEGDRILGCGVRNLPSCNDLGATPPMPTNVLCRKGAQLRKVLEDLGMRWVNWQVLRRSSASLMNRRC
jgi:hypothetical protein